MERYFEINEEGHNIRCKVYCRDVRDIGDCVIFLHGFGGHKDNNAAARFAEKLTAKHKRAALVTFDWPCHGGDVKKKLNLEDCSTYLRLVTTHVCSRFDTDSLYAYGTSFGGYLMLYYLKQFGNPFRKIVLRCPALNIREALLERIMTGEDREKLPKGKDIPVGFDRKVPIGMDFLKQLEENNVLDHDYIDYAEDMLIIHGTADEIIPYELSEKFADEQLVEFIPIEGADHRFRDVVKMDLASKYILQFFNL